MPTAAFIDGVMYGDGKTHPSSFRVTLLCTQELTYGAGAGLV